MTKESGGFDQIDQWKSTMFLYSSALKSINTKIEILNNEFIQLYNYNPIEHITSRLKTPESIVKKLKHDGCEVTIDNMVEHLNDIAGIRIICSFMSDIYPIADMIARQADITRRSRSRSAPSRWTSGRPWNTRSLISLRERHRIIWNGS